MWSVFMDMELALTQGVKQVALVPDRGAVRELASAGLCPVLHEGASRGIWMPVVITFGPASATREWRAVVHVASWSRSRHPAVLPGPRGPWEGCVGSHGPLRGGARDPDAPSRGREDGEDVPPRPGRGTDLEESAGERCVGPAAQRVRPGHALPFGRGRDAVLLEKLPGGGGGPDARRRRLVMEKTVKGRRARLAAGQSRP